MQSSKEAIQSLHDGANKYESRYCVTPRFAPTTSPEVMSEGARVAKEKIYSRRPISAKRPMKSNTRSIFIVIFQGSKTSVVILKSMLAAYVEDPKP